VLGLRVSGFRFRFARGVAFQRGERRGGCLWRGARGGGRSGGPCRASAGRTCVVVSIVSALSANCQHIVSIFEHRVSIARILSRATRSASRVCWSHLPGCHLRVSVVSIVSALSALAASCQHCQHLVSIFSIILSASSVSCQHCQQLVSIVSAYRQHGQHLILTAPRRAGVDTPDCTTTSPQSGIKSAFASLCFVLALTGIR